VVNTAVLVQQFPAIFGEYFVRILRSGDYAHSTELSFYGVWVWVMLVMMVCVVP